MAPNSQPEIWHNIITAFSSAWAQGLPWPRWAPEALHGAGAPELWLYPPLGPWLSLLYQKLWAWLPQPLPAMGSLPLELTLLLITSLLGLLTLKKSQRWLMMSVLFSPWLLVAVTLPITPEMAQTTTLSGSSFYIGLLGLSQCLAITFRQSHLASGKMISLRRAPILPSALVVLSWGVHSVPALVMGYFLCLFFILRLNQGSSLRNHFKNALNSLYGAILLTIGTALATSFYWAPKLAEALHAVNRTAIKLNNNPVLGFYTAPHAQPILLMSLIVLCYASLWCWAFRLDRLPRTSEKPSLFMPLLQRRQYKSPLGNIALFAVFFASVLGFFAWSTKEEHNVSSEQYLSSVSKIATPTVLNTTPIKVTRGMADITCRWLRQTELSCDAFVIKTAQIQPQITAYTLWRIFVDGALATDATSVSDGESFWAPIELKPGLHHVKILLQWGVVQTLSALLSILFIIMRITLNFQSQ